MSEKLQKFLANQGLASRRTIEKWIQEGRITVNGKIAELGCRIDALDKIYVDGKPIKRALSTEIQKRILLYHKPIGEICTRSDTEGRSTVFDHLPPLETGRWIVIGRLDINSCGLLLFTNDGEFANQMMHPSSEMEREYAVRVLGEVTQDAIKAFKKGVELEDGPAKFDKIEKMTKQEGANQWYRVSLHEGRHREVRRIFETQGLKVNRLIRVTFGHYTLPRELKPGEYEEL